MNIISYNREEIFKCLDKIEIIKNGDQVITKYKGYVKKVANVSNRYEIFDIVSYLKSKIDSIEKNFSIKSYHLMIKGGVQSLRLLSDEVEIGGVTFYKSFYIINSSDKSRRLTFSLGLQSKNGKFYAVSNNSFSKKHLIGVTESIEMVSDFDVESFDSQIESIQSLVGHRIKFSKIRSVILGDDVDIKKVNHRKYDAFKNSVRCSNQLNLTSEQIRFLHKDSESVDQIPRELDFYIDAFWVLQVYLNLFNRQDSHIVKIETDRIMNITQWAVRNEILESLGI